MDQNRLENELLDNYQAQIRVIASVLGPSDDLENLSARLQAVSTRAMSLATGLE